MRPTSFRLGALLAVGVLVVHELRYRVLDAQAGASTADAGHGYLGALTAVIGVLLVLALGHSVHRWAGGSDDGERVPRSAAVMWLPVSAAILAGYGGQELAAGVLSSGHPVGISGLLADGGWVALPIALACGGVIAAALRTAAALLRRGPGVTVRPPSLVPSFDATLTPTVGITQACRVPRHLAGRSPPVPLSR